MCWLLFLYLFLHKLNEEITVKSSARYAYGYVRVSTDKQEELSPDSQEKLLREYAAKNNIIILKVFFEIGISGRKADKRPRIPENDRACESLPDHPVDVILVWKFSGFAKKSRRIYRIQIPAAEAKQR